jgi:hypothetical protein
LGFCGARGETVGIRDAQNGILDTFARGEVFDDSLRGKLGPAIVADGKTRIALATRLSVASIAVHCTTGGKENKMWSRGRRQWANFFEKTEHQGKIFALLRSWLQL